MKELCLDTRKIREKLNSGISKTNTLGLELIEDSMNEKDLEGDSSENNFALSVFENALDWRIGLLAVALMKTAIRDQKHYIMRIKIDKHGDIYSAKTGEKLKY